MKTPMTQTIWKKIPKKNIHPWPFPSVQEPIVRNAMLDKITPPVPIAHHVRASCREACCLCGQGRQRPPLHGDVGRSGHLRDRSGDRAVVLPGLHDQYARDGAVTHLGRVDVVQSHCPYDLDNRHDGYMTITATNGDKLYGVYDYDPAGENGVTAITFDGGTGRFADASGAVGITYDVVFQFRPIPPCDPNTDIFGCLNPDVPWPWTATLSGTITY